MMENFSKTSFHGTFRDYQKSVLDNSKKFLKDKKIHIVAAPGSGKTTLGLELIRRLNAPALVFSPSVTIREQWGERFTSSFLNEGDNGKYISYDLRFPELITSVTYQALHAAWTRTQSKEEDEEGEETDFSAFDLLDTVKKTGIKTICLDEAHHLRSEWQKALEEFIASMGTDITVIALTATPPYDSTPAQWKRYCDICGETDDEIYVPQLVAQKNLCPHQDYIYFNYPTEKECDELKKTAGKVKGAESANKILSFSAGKLESIKSIVKNEQQNMGDKLRMLILTDYIRKEALSLVGTDEEVDDIGTVPVFEAVRRDVSPDVKIAMLSGSLVIVPTEISGEVVKIAETMNCNAAVKNIENTEHSEIVFSGSNKNKVAVMTKVFGDGLINILIGTKALLGEGWDSPCINSLILASFVGSFMLSNQMRGRAIRTDRNDPDKTANIWHLVTLPPPGIDTEGADDFSVLKRRCSGFLAPAYNSDIIENGTERFDFLPEKAEDINIEEVNAKMLSTSADRTAMKSRWTNALKGKIKPEVADVNTVPEEFIPTVPTGKNILTIILAAIIMLIILILPLWTVLKILAVIAGTITILVSISAVKKAKDKTNTLNGIALGLLDCLHDNGILNKGKAEVITEKKDDCVSVILKNTGVHEKNIFSKALNEFFSPVEDPRYILILNRDKSSVRGELICFACPTELSKKKETVEAFASAIKKYTGTAELLYTRNDNAKKTAEKCRVNSVIAVSEKKAKSKKAVI